MTSVRKTLAATAALGVALALAGPACALSVFTIGLTNTTGPGGDPGVAAGQTIVDNYNATDLPSNGVARTGTQSYLDGITEIDQGPVALYNATVGTAAQPYDSGTAFGNFEALQPGGTATFEFNGADVKSFSAYLGSIDQYNYIDILGAGGKVLDQISGTDLFLNNWGNQSAAITNRRLFIDDLPSGATGIEFFTQGIAFEFDDIAVSTMKDPIPPSGPNVGPAIFGAVPEPATWAVMLLGLFGVGGALRASRRNEPDLAEA